MPKICKSPPNEYYGDDHEEYWFTCPGCKDDHYVQVTWGTKANRMTPRWTFNGSLDKPTFSPSLLVEWNFSNGPKKVCHSFVTDGRIQFLSDCTHELKGQTIELPEMVAHDQQS